AAQKQIGPEPAERDADAAEDERVARIAADRQQEEKHTAEHQGGERFDAEIVGGRPAVRVARKGQLALNGFEALDLAVPGVLGARLLESGDRVRQLADERAQHALAERLPQLDLLQAARPPVEGG